MKNDTQRIFLLDNLKALLIFLVVWGHILENSNFLFSEGIYRFIYLFHMPLFVFISGYCFSKNTKIISNLFVKYIFFQFIYSAIFSYFSISEFEGFSLMTPIWILWYLFSLMTWQLLMKFFNLITSNWLYVLVIAWICALLIGYNSSVGYYASLSRTINLFPFFLLGFITRENNLLNKIKEKNYPFFIKNKFAIVFLTGGVIVLLFIDSLYIKILYHVQIYEIFVYSIIDKVFLQISILLTMYLIIKKMSVKYIPFITNLGKKTLAIYLLHGLIVKLWFHFYPPLENYGFLLSLMMALVITAFLALPIWTIVLQKINSDSLLKYLKK